MIFKDIAIDILSGLVPYQIKKTVFENTCRSFPITLGIEVTNICCANCSFCGYRFQQRKKGVMGEDVYKKTIDEYCDIGGGSINLTPTVGEPLLDNNIIDKIRYARSKKKITDIWFYTNLIPLSKANVNDLLTSGITAIKISTCICDEKTFKKIYKVDSYKKVLRNIHLICESNNKLNKRVNIHLSMRVPKPFSKTTDNMDFKSIKQYFKEEEIHFFDELYDSWGGRIKESDLPSGYGICQNRFDMTKEPCYELFRKVNVLYNGEVNFCSCRDLNADLKIGNIKDDSLLDIWRGKRLAGIRNNWFMGNVPDICFDCQRYLPLSLFYKKYQKDIVNRYLRNKCRL